MISDYNGNTYVCYKPRETSIWFGDTEKKCLTTHGELEFVPETMV